MGPRYLKFGSAGVYGVCGKPLGGFRAQAICPSENLAPFLERVELLHAGLIVVVKRQGVRMFLISLHLPHAQRDDCIQVWGQTMSDLDSQLACLRNNDAVCIGAD